MSDYADTPQQYAQMSYQHIKPLVDVLISEGTCEFISHVTKNYLNDFESAVDELNKHMQWLMFHWEYVTPTDGENLDEYYVWLETAWQDLISEWEKNINFDEMTERGAIRPSVHRWLSFKKTAGYIYLVKGIFDTPTYKIGYSKTPKKRIRKFNVVLPFPIETMHLIETNHMRAVEAYLHDKYSSKRVNGEWFELNEQDIADICAIDSLNAEDIAS